VRTLHPFEDTVFSQWWIGECDGGLGQAETVDEIRCWGSMDPQIESYPAKIVAVSLTLTKVRSSA
jgi:hypothetical protein